MTTSDATYETEHDLQTALFEWVEWRANQEPALRLMFAIPNGQYRPGQRPEAGIQSGVPDLFLPVPRGPFCGLFLELKLEGGHVRPEQRQWLGNLAAQGYRTANVYGFNEAVQVIEEYLETTL